jgi:hypothetical protein
MAAGALHTGDKPIPLEERQALVERIAGSNELRRAARLRAFLLYVWGRAAADPAVVIHETEIGSAVFGRPEFYDTAVDNIVRVNATELRKRLEKYFADEGAHEQLVLEIQRGGYVPVIRRRIAQEAPAAEPAPAPAATEAAPLNGGATEPASVAELAPAAVQPPISTATLRWWQTACVLLALGCAGLFWWAHTLGSQLEPWKADPALRAFWSQFFDSGVETDVVLADTSFGVAEDIMQRTSPLPDYLNYNYKRYADSPELPQARREDLQQVLNRNNGSDADFRVSQQILSLTGGPGRFNLKFAREYTADAAKHHNIVLIGSRESNPWVGLFSDRLNFNIDYDPVQHMPIVSNRSPQPGEDKSYAVPQNRPDSSTGYAVIAFLPDVSGHGKVLIIEGTDSQATGAAGDFVTSPDSLGAFEQKFPAGSVPFFEVLLHTSQLSGTPLHAEILAYRIYK